MPTVQIQPTLAEQVVNAIVSEIVEGELPANSRLIQDHSPGLWRFTAACSTGLAPASEAKIGPRRPG